jgi:hypothetical protein
MAEEERKERKSGQQSAVSSVLGFFGVSFEFMALHGIGVSPNGQK